MAFTPSEEALLRQLLDQQSELLNLADSESEIISKLGATKVTLSDLDAASSTDDSDLLLARQGTEDKSLTLDLLRSYAQGNSVLLTGTQYVAGFKSFGDDIGINTRPFGDRGVYAANTTFVQDAIDGLHNRIAPAQSYQDVTSDRDLDTTYYNTGNYPYVVFVTLNDNGTSGAPDLILSKAGSVTATIPLGNLDGSSGYKLNFSFIAFPDQGYQVTSDGCTLSQWVEAQAV